MTRLPSLGPRGEGWVAIQVVLLVAIGLAGMAGPVLTGNVRVAAAVLGAVLVAAGLWLAVAGIVQLRETLTPLPYPRDDARLVQTGAYGLVRHPIYGGLILGAVGWGLATASPAALVLTGVLVGFFELKSRREEAWLQQRFSEYAAYRARTPRLIPGFGGDRD
jgi:protein-S-isoprenylcysteine O-methyltransferase Ste14